MAAICGTSNLSGQVSGADVDSALSRMPLRGGLVREIHTVRNFGIGCARTDPANNGGLFCSEDRKVWVACDGRIFNEHQLIKEHMLGETSAATILPWLYQYYGEHFVNKLEGSFSLVVWDETKNLIILIRDHIGSKPLFYSLQSGTLVFASEINGLMSFKGVAATLDLESLDSYLTYLYVPAPRTLLKNIWQVAPAHLSKFEQSNILSTNFYLNRTTTRFEDNALDLWSTEVRELLDQSIKLRLDAKENVGFLLSGGTDTAALLGCASLSTTSPLKTFTLGFNDCAEADEKIEAERTSRYFQTQHTALSVSSTCIESLPEVTKLYGSPIGNPAFLISSALFKQLRGLVEAVICGDGGNEIFGGVYKYNQAMNYLVNSKGGPFRRIVQACGQRLWGKFRETKLEPLVQKSAKLYFEGIGKHSKLSSTQLDKTRFDEVVNFYCLLETIWAIPNKKLLYNADVAEVIPDYNSYEFLRSFFVQDNCSPVLQQLTYARTNSFIPYNAIPYIEFNATANNVFSLFPFLDKRLLSFMYKVPFEYVYGKAHRYFMRQALAKHVVPTEIFRRPGKGFNTPLTSWMSKPKWREIVYDYLSFQTIKDRGLFSPAYVGNLINQYYSGRKFITTEHSGKVQPVVLSIWSLVALEAWFQEFL